MATERLGGVKKPLSRNRATLETFTARRTRKKMFKKTEDLLIKD